jgi:hypothetical protein
MRHKSANYPSHQAIWLFGSDELRWWLQFRVPDVYLSGARPVGNHRPPVRPVKMSAEQGASHRVVAVGFAPPNLSRVKLLAQFDPEAIGRVTIGRAAPCRVCARALPRAIIARVIMAAVRRVWASQGVPVVKMPTRSLSGAEPIRVRAASVATPEMSSAAVCRRA